MIEIYGGGTGKMEDKGETGTGETGDTGDTETGGTGDTHRLPNTNYLYVVNSL